MKKALYLILIAASIFNMWNCSGMLTRQETDVYTISERDTTSLYYMQNAPGERDNGVVYPSSRTFKSERYLIQRDSVVDRFYPNFIRLGVVESVGLMFSGPSEYASGSGLFGIFNEWNEDLISGRGGSDYVFSGRLLRIGIGEWRLRWFRDAANWTIGTSLFESISPDSRYEKTLASFLPIYLRKRYYLREEIPYIAITPAFGIGWWPSQYINVSASIDVGSIGGLNLRAYAGLAAGSNSAGSPQVMESPYTNEAQTTVAPYFGLGISFLDFLNIVPETYTEWKDHEHSSWDIGLLQVAFLSSGSKSSIFANDEESSIFNGMMLKIANTAIALPIFDHKVYAGTSLLNVVAVGKTEWGIGTLPIRIGMWQTILQDELSVEPFIEYNYYPSSFYNLAVKVNLRLSDQINFGGIVGYASGSTIKDIGNNITETLGISTDFSAFYLGVSIGLFDRIFFPENLRYNKEPK